MVTKHTLLAGLLAAYEAYPTAPGDERKRFEKAVGLLAPFIKIGESELEDYVSLLGIFGPEMQQQAFDHTHEIQASIREREGNTLQ